MRCPQSMRFVVWSASKPGKVVKYRRAASLAECSASCRQANIEIRSWFEWGKRGRKMGIIMNYQSAEVFWNWEMKRLTNHNGESRRTSRDTKLGTIDVKLKCIIWEYVSIGAPKGLQTYSIWNWSGFWMPFPHRQIIYILNCSVHTCLLFEWLVD